MIDNEKIRDILERMQQAKEADTFARSLLTSLTFHVMDIYRRYGTEEGVEMSKGSRKKAFFKAVKEAVQAHYSQVKGFIHTKALNGFKEAYERYISAIEKEIGLPLERDISEKAIQDEWKKTRSLQKTITYNKNLTFKQLRKQFLQSFRIKETVDKLLKRVRGVIEKDTARVKQVTEQETAAMQSIAQYKSMEDSEKQGVTVQYFWTSLRDGKVRDTHKRLHGQKADKDGYFHLNGKKARHPHMWGVPSLDINCRCYLSIVGVNLKDSALERELQEAKDSSERRKIWEERRKNRKRK